MINSLPHRQMTQVSSSPREHTPIVETDILPPPKTSLKLSGDRKQKTAVSSFRILHLKTNNAPNFDLLDLWNAIAIICCNGKTALALFSC